MTDDIGQLIEKLEGQRDAAIAKVKRLLKERRDWKEAAITNAETIGERQRVIESLRAELSALKLARLDMMRKGSV